MKPALCLICKTREAAYWGGKLSNFGACGNVDCLVTRVIQINDGPSKERDRVLSLLDSIPIHSQAQPNAGSSDEAGTADYLPPVLGKL